MKITAEQLELIKSGELSLDEVNKQIQDEVAKSYTSGVEKTKAELIEKSLETEKSKFIEDETIKNDENSEVIELKKRLEELENSSAETKSNLAIDSFRKKTKNSMSEEQINMLIETVPFDKLETLNVDLFKRDDVENLGTDKSENGGSAEINLEQEELQKAYEEMKKNRRY